MRYNRVRYREFLLYVRMAFCVRIILGVLLAAVSSNGQASTPATLAPNCGYLDLAFVVDHSGSINDNDEGPKPNWDYILDFMVSIVNGLDVGSASNRVGVVTFGSQAQVDFNFQRFSNKQDVTAAIRQLQNTGGNTNTTGALRLMRQGLFAAPADPTRPPNTAKVCVLITDGVPSQRFEADGLPAELTNVKAAGIRVLAVGVTTAVDETFLRSLVSSPSTDYFKVMAFSDLPGLLNSITAQFCPSSSTISTTASTPPVSTASTTPTPPVLTCLNRADVAVLLDVSADITFDTFRLMREFTANMAYSFNVNNDFTRLAVVTFADAASSSIYLNTYAGRSTAELVAAIRATRFVAGGTNTSAGLSFVLDRVFTSAAGDRPDVPNILLLLVGGPSNNFDQTAKLSSDLKGNFIQIIGIAINGASYETEVNSVVSYPYISNRILLNSASDLSGVLSRTVDMLCNNVNECLQNASCQHGGTCVDSINRYLCFCPPPYAGLDCGLTCRAPADVVFALDGSGSIGASVFLKYVDFLRSVVDGLSDSTRVGAVIFSDSQRILFQLNTFNNKQNIIDAMYTYYPGGTTNTAGAIEVVRQVMFTPANGDRPNVPNVLVVVTDGGSNNQNATLLQASLAKNANITILSVGVGSSDDFNKNELDGMSSYPPSANVFRVPDEDSFGNIVAGLVAAICNNVNACDSNPCQNGGTCASLQGAFTCSCPDGYTGLYCQKACSAYVDLVFIIDSSGSIRRERFPAVINFFASIVEQIELGRDKTQVGALIFGDVAHVQFNLNTYSSKGDVVTAVKSTPFLGERTNIASALWILRNTSYLPANGGRANAQKVAILFTDGDSNVDSQDTIPYAVLARNAQILLIVVGMGTDIDFNELYGIASRPFDRTILTTQSSAGLPGLVANVTSAFCDDVNECASSPCQHSGTCINSYGR